jgi:hypothetical protein
MPLYHVQVYMPALNMPKGQFKLIYSEHAKREAARDRYGKINAPMFLNPSDYQVVEVETDNNKNVRKIVYRGYLDSKRDIAIVVIPQGSAMFVKTVWVNLNTDKHGTLDHSKYDKR